MMDNFEEALQRVLQEHGLAAKTGIPLKVLTDYLIEHLSSVGLLIQQRERMLGHSTVLSSAETLLKK